MIYIYIYDPNWRNIFFEKQVRKKIVDASESQIGDLITYFLPVDL